MLDGIKRAYDASKGPLDFISRVDTAIKYVIGSGLALLVAAWAGVNRLGAVFFSAVAVAVALIVMGVVFAWQDHTRAKRSGTHGTLTVTTADGTVHGPPLDPEPSTFTVTAPLQRAPEEHHQGSEGHGWRDEDQGDIERLDEP